MAAKRKTRVASAAAPQGNVIPLFRAFDAGKFQRRLRSMPTAANAINAQIRRYGKTILARSRYLAANNPYTSAAKEEFTSALVGNGIKPSPLTKDAKTKADLLELWLDWTDEADADNQTDLYGLQDIAASEMFEAGECFGRFRPRLKADGLSVPLQIQLLPAEMLPLEYNQDLGNGRRIECGIEFDAIGRRTAYHFLRRHPGSDAAVFDNSGELYSVVPAEQVVHLYKPIRAGQIRGIPHTLSAIVKCAIMDQYDDAELERKRTAALFAAFIERPLIDDGTHPLGNPETLNAAKDGANDGSQSTVQSAPMEPGATIDLQPGEKVSFAQPADVGASYEMFQYRTLLALAAGMGVPYAAMTGDLRQTSYGSIRAGLVQFRRRIEKMQNAVMIFQFCRPIWQRWLEAAAIAGALPVTSAQYLKRKRELQRVKWQPPKWDWIDPLKDIEAESLAVQNGFKSRSDTIEEMGEDAEQVDARVKADRDREKQLGLSYVIGLRTPVADVPPEGDGGAAPATTLPIA